MRWWIYALIEPRPDHERYGQPRYVGKSFDLQRRLKSHLSGASRRSTRKERWLYAVIQEGLKPPIILLESGIGEESWQKAECKWIAHYREQGCALTNGTGGGEGGCPTPEVRAKISAAKKNPSPETRAKLAAAQKGRRYSRKTKEKLSAIRKGRARKPLTAETKNKISAALTGRTSPLKGVPRGPHSAETKAKITAGVNRPEVKAKISAGLKGRPGTFKGKTHSPEARAKISAARKAQPPRQLSAEHKAKIAAANKRRSPELWAQIAAANKGQKRSPETRARMSAAKKNTKKNTGGDAPRTIGGDQ